MAPAVIGLACAVCGCLAAIGCSTHSAAVFERLTVYVGTYTDGGSRVIYRLELNPDSGAATDPVLAGVSENPSFRERLEALVRSNDGFVIAEDESAHSGAW